MFHRKSSSTLDHSQTITVFEIIRDNVFPCLEFTGKKDRSHYGQQTQCWLRAVFTRDQLYFFIGLSKCCWSASLEVCKSGIRSRSSFLCPKPSYLLASGFVFSDLHVSFTFAQCLHFFDPSASVTSVTTRQNSTSFRTMIGNFSRRNICRKLELHT